MFKNQSTLFLTIFFYLLSSSITFSSDEGVTVYRWDTSYGKTWKKFGEEDVHDKYVGEVNESNFPEGLGTLTYLNGDRYFGEFEKGLRNGLGTYIWSNHKHHEKYVGEFTNDKFGKIGKIFYKNGQKYDGEVLEKKIKL
jgi:Uncharacterized protein conserved in bacteria